MRPAAHCASHAALAFTLLVATMAARSACAQAAPASDLLYLEVSVNGRPSGLIMPFSGANGSLRTSAANLRQLGLADAALGQAEVEGEIALDRLAGLRYTLDVASQSVALHVDDALRAPFLAAARATRVSAPASASPGAVLNYDLASQLGATRATMWTGELRLFNATSAFSTSGTLLAGPGLRQALRYDSYWQWSDESTLRVLQVGDVITGALPWSRSLRLGGVQWRKNFALRPDLLTYPTASVSGSAVVPSALSLYVNGVQQYSGEVPDGPFVLQQVAGINGAGEASVVTRDALGRATVTALPLYVDTRMLAPGLWDYTAELGALRRNYGQRSFDYDNAPQFSGALRYGLSAGLTLEGHAEAGDGLLSGGAGILAALGGYGVLSAHAAGSTGSGRGVQGGIGYQYLGRRFAVDAALNRASADFADLAARAGAPVPRAQDRLALNWSLPGRQSLGLSHVHLVQPGARAARIRALSYGVTLGQRMFISLSAFADARNRASRGVTASVALAFGERGSASMGGGRQNGVAQRALQVARAPDFGGGFGWNAQVADSGAARFGQAQVRYLGSEGQLGASAYQADGKSSALLEASGALVIMDGTLAPARQVGSGFALVSTGLPGVPVLHENRVIGKTGAQGYLLVPNLNPYSENRLGIEVGALPANARVPRNTMTVVPRSLSGVLVALPVGRFRAASVILRDADGVLLAPGTPLRHRESGAETVVGHDGIAFIDQLEDSNTLDGGEGSASCTVRFAWQDPADASLPVLGPLQCERRAP